MWTITIQADKNIIDEIKEFIKNKKLNAKFDDTFQSLDEISLSKRWRKRAIKQIRAL